MIVTRNVKDRYMKIAQKYKLLNKASMKGMEGINIWELVYYWIDAVDCGVDFIHFFGRVLKVFFRDYGSNGNGDIAFIFSNAAGNRTDHLKCFHDICSTITDRISIFPKQGYNINIKALHNLRYLWYWFKEGHKLGLRISQSASLTAMLFHIKSEGDKIYGLIGSTKYIVTYCDVIPQEYYVTWLAKRDKKTTATVEHGFYPAGSRQFVASKSDYFIANTAIGADYAKQAGIKNVLIGGLMSDIYSEEANQIRHNGIFAVLLDVMGNNETHEIDNAQMLQLSEHLANENNLNYIIRYHPADTGRIIHNMNSVRLCYLSLKDESIADLLNKVDFIIANQSTTYFQAISKLIPALRYIGISGDNMPSIDFGVFHNYMELIKCYDVFIGMTLQDMRELKRRIIGANDIFGQYKRTFNHIRGHE